ncbi:MAG: Gfo/Idh/MocA family oxidoreductase [Ginsengibacter sp.]
MRFLIIGGGSIGKRHIQNLKNLGFTDIFCLKRKTDTEFAGENKVKVITDISELENTSIDAVIVCTPTSLHNEGLKIAAELKASVFMEKPLIHNHKGLIEAKKILNGFQQPFFIGFMLRFHPLVQKIASLLRDKYLGEVYSARFEFGSYLPYWHPWEDYRDSYASQKQLGGGVINTITHELDLIQYYFGDPLNMNCTKANLNRLHIEVEEIAEAVFDYENKIITLHIDFLQKDYDRRIRILCDEGSIEWNWHENKIVVKHHKKEAEYYPLDNFDVNQLYIDELKQFIQIIKNKTLHHPLDFDHAEKNTSLMLNMHEASEQKQTLAFKIQDI